MSLTAGHLAPIIARLCSQIAPLSAADRQGLRQMQEPRTRLFWRLLVREVQPHWLLPARARTTERAEAERRWAVIFSLLARTSCPPGGLRTEAWSVHQPQRALGPVLARALWREARLRQLLTAQGRALHAAVLGLGDELFTKRLQANLTPLCWLVVSEGRAVAAQVKRTLERGFYEPPPREG